MTSIRTLAAEYHMESYAVAAGLGLGSEYDETAEIVEADEAWMREALDILAADADKA